MTSLFETESWIEGPVRLEARLHQASGPAGLVVTHPHPLYGGSMENNVVQALVEAGAAAGLSTLRFNFRGVGSSQGAFDQGLGEQEDLLAALDHLTGLGLSRLCLAAYSFGSWVAAAADYGSRPLVPPIWVAPPVGMMPIEADQVGLKPGLILAGGRDAFAPATGVFNLARDLGPGVRVERLERADHFFFGFEDWLREEAVTYLNGALT